ncbi:MAG: hypothetical protein ACREIV_01870 [Planctomycetaceae bacterium]
MERPLVMAYHLVWTGYGHWLPNDPRGSMSRLVRTSHVAELGDPHYGRRRIQPSSATIRDFHEQAHAVLKHPVLIFSTDQIEAIGKVFGEAVSEHRYTCYACAIMPNHVHLIIRKHRQDAEQMIDHFQIASRQRLLELSVAEAGHPIWTFGGWFDFLDHPREMRSLIRYIERNPSERGLPPQSWPFVKKYDGWPLHPGHNPNSPWARRLRAWERERRGD